MKSANIQWVNGARYWTLYFCFFDLGPGRQCIAYHSRLNRYMSDCGTAVCRTHLLNHALYIVLPLLFSKPTIFTVTVSLDISCIAYIIIFIGVILYMDVIPTGRILKGKGILIVHDLRVLITQTERFLYNSLRNSPVNSNWFFNEYYWVSWRNKNQKPRC